MSSDIKNIAGTSVLSTGTKTQGPEPSATLAKTAINKWPRLWLILPPLLPHPQLATESTLNSLEFNINFEYITFHNSLLKDTNNKD